MRLSLAAVRITTLVAGWIGVVACTAPEPGAPPDDAGATTDASVDTTACSPLFAQDLLPEYQVTIAPVEWAKLDDEFLHLAERTAAGLDPNPYHPIQFSYQGQEVGGVMIRLHGNSSWRAAIALDPDPKMQFVISFDQVAHDGRFFGMRKIVLDMPRDDHSFLRQRVALAYLRSLGLEAQCANNARLVINGSYYGLYTNLEEMDVDFLRRVFPGASDGDLWEGGRTIKTNKTTFSWAHLDAFWAVQDAAQLAAIADVRGAVRDWAGEAMMPDADGYYGGGHNYYLYDHPTRGFVWLSHDLDEVFDRRPFDISPVFWNRSREPALHYLLVMNDPTWQSEFVAALGTARAGYHVDELQGDIDAWSAQIADAAAADSMKPFTTADHVAAVATMRAYLPVRAGFIDGWLACRHGGGIDADGDGSTSCFDCDDTDPTVYPGATETCDGLDDNCNGWLDDVAPPQSCALPRTR